MTSEDIRARADRMVALHVYAAATELYEQVVEELPPGSAVKYGEALFHVGDYPAAERVLRSALAGGEQTAPDWLSDVLIITDRPDEAAHVMERAAEQGSPRAALRAAAIWADEVGDRAKAEEWYRKAVDQGAPGSLNDYGAFLSEDDTRSTEAEILLRQAAEQGDTLAFGNLGGMELDRGDPEAAIVWLRQGLEAGASPGSSAVLKLAIAEERLGNRDAARVHFDRAVEEDIPSALLQRAQFLADDEGPTAREAAEGDFRAAIEKDDEGALYYYARFLAKNGRLDEAADYYRQAIDSGSDAAYEDLGLLHQERGDTGSAEESFQASIAAGWLSAVFSYADLLRQEDRASEIEGLIPQAEALGANTDQLDVLRVYLRERN
jgi:Tfp pilus assembly protein PilF